MHKTQVQVDQGPQHKFSYIKPYGRERWEVNEHINIGDHFLNVTPAAQTLRETINGTLRRLKVSVRQRT